MRHRLVQTLRGLIAAGLLTALCAAGASAAPLGTGTVTTDGLRLRSQASTNSTILTMVNTGAKADVLSKEENGWYKVSFKGTEGYMSAQYLTVEWAKLATGTVNVPGSSLNVRSGPGTGYRRIGSLNHGAQVELLDQSNGWYQVRSGGLTGYVSGEYILPAAAEEAPAPEAPTPTPEAPAPKVDIQLPAEPDPQEPQTAGEEEIALPPEAVETAPVSTKGQEVVAYARTLLGKPYVYGGTGPNGFDCSGFVYYVHSHFGVTLNRGATGQLSNGTEVARADLIPGDLVFFYDGKVSTPASHVGIYVGDGEFIHASTNTYSVIINSMTSGTYDRMYVTARRIFE